MPKSIVLDANALLMPFQFKVNLDRELKRLFGDVPILVPSSVLGELGNALDKNARAALALARKYHIAETELSGDDAIMDVAMRHESAVVTNDRELIRRLRAERVPIVRLRSERYLVADDF